MSAKTMTIEDQLESLKERLHALEVKAGYMGKSLQFKDKRINQTNEELQIAFRMLARIMNKLDISPEPDDAD